MSLKNATRETLPLNEAVARMRAIVKGGNRCLWPAPYDADSEEAAWGFVRLCRTWNEAAKEEQAIPDLEYLRVLTREWYRARKAGRTLIVEKCRRMVVSWLFRCLELWEMGLGRCDQILGGVDFDAAAKHVWRLRFLYDGLRARHPSWRLGEAEAIRYEGERKLKSLTLPNGSVCGYANGDTSTVRGDGTARVTLEEFGTFRYAAAMLAQAKIVTKGAAGTVGGAVVLVTNASTGKDWQRVKNPSPTPGGTGATRAPEPSPLPLSHVPHEASGNGRGVPGPTLLATSELCPSGTRVAPVPPGEGVSSLLMRGLEARDLPSGARYLKLHYYADPGKDEAWRAAVEMEMIDTPFEYRREILMEDSQAKGALWKHEWFDRFGFRWPRCLHKTEEGIVAAVPESCVKVIVAVDPSVSDPEAAKDPNKLPDECGLIGAGVTEDRQGVILADLSDVMAPEAWGRKAVKLARLLGATEIHYETNQGGAMVRDTIKQFLNDFPELGEEPIRLVPVHAFQGKRARAEPVSVLYANGRAHHCGALDALEHEQTNWDASNPAARSPNRIDAVVIAMHGLKLAEFRTATVHRRRSQSTHADEDVFLANRHASVG